ncbi:hypothetical protein NLM59_11675, partial [Weeksellaceae bacterium KMM 9724]|nr:hypothetical protein [Profundicola chukchiensis]
WKAVRDRDPGASLSEPGQIAAPERWPDREALSDWQLSRAMRRGRDIVAGHHAPGEAAAQDRLAGFVEAGLERYGEG